jgi:hypothetical protein
MPLTRREDAATSPRKARGEVKNYSVQPPSMMWATPVVKALSSLAR